MNAPLPDVVLDVTALDARKPSAGPLVEPAEAVAIGLSIVPSMGKRLFSPEGPEVRQVLLALKLAGWEIVPRSRT
jgi:hypothetical protein